MLTKFLILSSPPSFFLVCKYAPIDMMNAMEALSTEVKKMYLFHLPYVDWYFTLLSVAKW